MIIIQDTREKTPWDFSSYDECEGQVLHTIAAGDYIIKGRETLITIDRKSRPSELAENLGMYIKRFEREMIRMQKYTFRYVLCEFPYEKLLRFPYGCGLPKFVVRKIRVRGKFLVKQAGRLSEEYGVEFIFCADRSEAREKAMTLFKEAILSEE